MISKWRWIVLRFVKRLWFRPAIFALIGLATALFSVFFSPQLPPSLAGKIGADAVDGILNILATSMLTVTTFSLTSMVTAYGSAASNATPRATRLVVEDSTTQNVVATFIGAFLFSLVGIVSLSTGAYGDQGRVILFVATLIVIAVIVLTLLRWVDHLSRLGQMIDTIGRVEAATANAMQARQGNPYLGGLPLPKSPESDLSGFIIHAQAIGYIQHVDVGALNTIAKEHKTVLDLMAVSGSFVGPNRPIAKLGVAVDDKTKASIQAAFTIADTRSYEQDPRFGFCVLSEIASRALSPAVNDPGTAIDVIGRAVRLLAMMQPGEDEKTDPERKTSDVAFPHVRVPALDIQDLFADVFAPIGRDGAAMIEVQICLQKALADLSSYGDDFTLAARTQSRRAMQHAKKALVLAEDFDRLSDIRTDI
ncbi:putative membrane protein [Agrobacterium vitis]|nr:putative membrane protein [Agrobacterium vitis]